MPEASYVDVLTAEGRLAAGLPSTYPLDDSDEIPWDRCQPIGLRAWNGNAPGIACRSAATPRPRLGEELAWFERLERLQVDRVMPFSDWYWSG